MRKWAYLAGAVLWTIGGIVVGVTGRQVSVGLSIMTCLVLALVHMVFYLEERGEPK